MSEISFPYRSIMGDREYFPEDFAEYFEVLVSSGVVAAGDNLPVTSSGGMSVTLGDGRAWVVGRFYKNKAPKKFILAVGGTHPRIDRLIVRHDTASRRCYALVTQGVAAAEPLPPPLVRDEETWDICLAEIFIPAGAIDITQENITDTRLVSELCGIIYCPVDHIEMDGFLKQSQATFERWFKNLEHVLDGDVAGKLLNMILELEEKTDSMGAHSAVLSEWDDDDKCFVENPQIQSTGQFILAYPDGAEAQKATASLLSNIEVVDGGFYVTRNRNAEAEIKLAYTIAKRIDDSIPSGGMISSGQGRVISGQEIFGVPGTYMFAVKVTGMHRITIIGAGGAGGGRRAAGGGGSGGIKIIETFLTAGEQIAITVGAGGTTIATVSGQRSQNGGASSFGAIVSVSGGEGGQAGDNGEGGQGSTDNGSNGGKGLVSGTNYSGGGGAGSGIGAENGVDGERGVPGRGGAAGIHGARGGNAQAGTTTSGSGGRPGAGGGGASGTGSVNMTTAGFGGDGLVQVEWGYAA